MISPHLQTPKDRLQMKTVIKDRIALHAASSTPPPVQPVEHVDHHANLHPAWDPNAPMRDEPLFKHGERNN